MTLHPSEGIRLLLERQEVADDKSQARYDAWVYTVNQSFAYRATLGLDGSCELVETGDAAAEEDHEQLLRIARSTARAAKRKLDDKLPPWPPRVLRWRGPGRGS